MGVGAPTNYQMTVWVKLQKNSGNGSFQYLLNCSGEELNISSEIWSKVHEYIM